MEDNMNDNYDEIFARNRRRNAEARAANGQADYRNIDGVLDVFANGQRESRQQRTYDTMKNNFERDQARYAQADAAIRMRENSLNQKTSSNKRGKTKSKSNWPKVAVATTIAAIIFVSGIKLSDTIIDNLEKNRKLWELDDDVKAFQEMVEKDYTATTFTGDKQIKYDEIAQNFEKSDGVIDNRELYIMVSALGEVNANQVLEEAKNPQTTNVEDYMRGKNISSMSDWKDKTVQEMIAQSRFDDAQTELATIFTTTQEETVSNDTYGGK